MNLIDKDTNKDAIIAYLVNPAGEHDSLSDKQKSLLQYYTDAYSMIRNYRSVPDAIQVLVKFSKERGEPISVSTARRYIYDAQDVFGYASKTKPEAIRHLSLEIIKDAIAMARAQNNPEAMIRGAEKMITISGADQQEIFNAEMLERHIIELGMDKKSQRMIQHLTTLGPIDLDNLVGNVMNNMAEDGIIIPDEEDDAKELSAEEN